MPDAILVTGGAGYVGSQVSKALRRQGFLPVAYDNLSRGNRWAVKWGPLEEGDLADRERLVAVMQKYRPAAIMHFAAYCYVAESVADPLLYYRNNVVGSVDLFEAAGRCGIRKLVFSSSCATYGDPLTPQIAETHPQNPTNPYGATKLVVERILRDMAAARGLTWASLRYFNAAGADPDGDLGEAHDPETRLIPLAIRAAMAPNEPLTVFGTDYPTPDGTAIRDYVHVVDLATAHILALQHLLSGGGSLAVNLGTGHGHSVLEVIAAVERSSGRRVAVRYGPRRPGDPPSMVADATFVRQKLGWQASYQDLGSIIETAWRWHSRKSLVVAG
jgi:UDP-arabinose 4-epimerase